ncbi:hypothetical protein BB561_005304 [Smittium simulii]|uniref:Integrase catalytic domain-containing protein n=1 Tax=Smittium simulii TaxID=133385 RepID=A0A2T9YB21_9FUNG|nr:hypothetical protein BB561_005304 [Smittium simulii]
MVASSNQTWALFGSDGLSYRWAVGWTSLKIIFFPEQRYHLGPDQKSDHQSDNLSGIKKKFEKFETDSISGLFTRWSIDFLEPLELTTRGNRYILTAEENLSRCLYVKAVTLIALPIVLAFVNELVRLLGVLIKIRTDRVACFTSNKFKERLNKLAYLPEWNGQFERLNGQLRSAKQKLKSQIVTARMNL